MKLLKVIMSIIKEELEEVLPSIVIALVRSVVIRRLSRIGLRLRT